MFVLFTDFAFSGGDLKMFSLCRLFSLLCCASCSVFIINKIIHKLHVLQNTCWINFTRRLLVSQWLSVIRRMSNSLLLSFPATRKHQRLELLQHLCAWKRRLGLQSTHFVSIRTSHNEHITGDTFATAF